MDGPRTLQRRVASAIENLYPGYFALVMATGIVSLAADTQGLTRLAWALLYLNVVAYVVLGSTLTVRLVAYPRAVLADVADHGRGPGFFTVVAGTCVLGTQLVRLAEAAGSARVLWGLGIVLWLLVMYAYFTATVIRDPKPTLEAGINGAWLLAVVATQSVSTLGTLLSAGRPAALFFALVLFLLGAMLYLTIITLIFYRFTFLTVTVERLTPPYWINMGAVAITTLAGSTLLASAESWGTLALLRPFLTGFTLFFWAAATWWIPLLVILGAWRHIVRRYPFRYDPQYWGMVFPLGMYAVSTSRMARVIDLPFLAAIPQVFTCLALLAWTVVFLAMLRTLASLVRREG